MIQECYPIVHFDLSRSEHLLFCLNLFLALYDAVVPGSWLFLLLFLLHQFFNECFFLRSWVQAFALLGPFVGEWIFAGSGYKLVHILLIF